LKIRNIVTQLISLTFQILLILFQLTDAIFKRRLPGIAVPILLCWEMAGTCQRPGKHCHSKNPPVHSSVLIISNARLFSRLYDFGLFKISRSDPFRVL
jgi:hypothetical protein